MANYALRDEAISLRKQGLTYSEIKQKLSVAKGTLSYWLREHPLTTEQIEHIEKKRYKRIEKYRETMRKKRTKVLEEVYALERNKIGELTDSELYIAGIGLYWGEGTKIGDSLLAMTNTDPVLLKFFIHWCVKSLNVPMSSLKATLHLYSDMDSTHEHQFWSKELSVPISQFWRPYVKKSKSTRINHKGGIAHGTCRISVGSAKLARKVLMGIKVIGDQFNRPVAQW